MRRISRGLASPTIWGRRRWLATGGFTQAPGAQVGSKLERVVFPGFGFTQPESQAPGPRAQTGKRRIPRVRTQVGPAASRAIASLLGSELHVGRPFLRPLWPCATSSGTWLTLPALLFSSHRSGYFYTASMLSWRSIALSLEHAVVASL